ncbi:ankyrin repeat domain-containing protein [Wolbachia endosymbiont of Tettigetta isshikii]|uniref:ankyrin repeat domain-containing protein n=1 Tax=Wolbachia endosymbiont of Tettigetta isshikii TaxID=3239093 RepID=UPI003980208D
MDKIEDTGNNGRASLFLATRQCTEAENDSRIEVIKYLIGELKANITRRDNNNNTVLFPAANNCPWKVVKLIIEQYVENFGSNKLKSFIDYKNKAGIDALDIALNSGNEKAIEVLRSYGADIENKINGESCLLRAVKEGDIKKTELLLKQGANVNTKDEKGLTSLDLAMQKSNQSMTQFLKENGAKTSLEIKVQLAVLTTLTVMTLGSALVVCSIMKGIREIAAKKPCGILNEVEGEMVRSSITQKV